MKIRTMAILLILLAAAQTATAVTYPQFLGVKEATGQIQVGEVNTSEQQIIPWTKYPSAPGTENNVYSDDTNFYIVEYINPDMVVSAFNKTTLVKAWSHITSNYWDETRLFAVDNLGVYVHEWSPGDSAYRIERLDPSNGSVVWQSTDFTDSSYYLTGTILTDDTHIYVYDDHWPTSGCQWIQINKTTGAADNTYSTIDSIIGTWTRLTVDEDTVYTLARTAGWDETIKAYNKSSGSLKWTYDIDYIQSYGTNQWVLIYEDYAIIPYIQRVGGSIEETVWVYKSNGTQAFYSGEELESDNGIYLQDGVIAVTAHVDSKIVGYYINNASKAYEISATLDAETTYVTNATGTLFYTEGDRLKAIDSVGNELFDVEVATGVDARSVTLDDDFLYVSSPSNIYVYPSTELEITPPQWTSWHNTYTNNTVTTFFAPWETEIGFSATADQTITTYKWYVNGELQTWPNQNSFWWGIYENFQSTHTVSVEGINYLGSTGNLTWTVSTNATSPVDGIKNGRFNKTDYAWTNTTMSRQYVNITLGTPTGSCYSDQFYESYVLKDFGANPGKGTQQDFTIRGQTLYWDQAETTGFTYLYLDVDIDSSYEIVQDINMYGGCFHRNNSIQLNQAWMGHKARLIFSGSNPLYGGEYLIIDNVRNPYNASLEPTFNASGHVYLEDINGSTTALENALVKYNETLYDYSDASGVWAIPGLPNTDILLTANKSLAMSTDSGTVTILSPTKDFTLLYSKGYLSTPIIESGRIKTTYTHNFKAINPWENPDYVWAAVKYDAYNGTSQDRWYYIQSNYDGNSIFSTNIQQNKGNYRLYFTSSDIYNDPTTGWHPTLSEYRQFNSSEIYIQKVDIDGVIVHRSHRVKEKELAVGFWNIIPLLLFVLILVAMGSKLKEIRR